jgi:hypothetical protein
MATNDEMTAVFAASVLPKVIALRELELGKKQLQRIVESIGQDIRKYTDLIPPETSRKAKGMAAAIGLDLRSKGWHEQPRFDPGRRTFHFEHVITVKDAIHQCRECNSTSDVVDILRRLRVAWILKSENDELTRRGFVEDRPPNAYELVGIELVD